MPLNDSTKTIELKPNQLKAFQPLRNAQAQNESRGRSRNSQDRSRSNSGSISRQSIRSPTTNAEELKVPVPNTFLQRGSNLKHQTSQSTLGEQENGVAGNRLVKEEPNSQSVNHAAYQMYVQNDDDTTDIITGDKEWDPDKDYSDDVTQRFAPVAAQAPLQLSPGWQAEADAERLFLGQPPLYSGFNHSHRRPFAPPSNDDSFSGIGDYDDDEDYRDDLQELKNKTPSRTTVIPSPTAARQKDKKQVKIASEIKRGDQQQNLERHSSPLPDLGQARNANSQQSLNNQNALARHSDYKQQVNSLLPSLPPPDPLPALTNTALKVSSYHPASEEEALPEVTVQRIPNTPKRPHAEIDYASDDLKSRTYASLSSIPFLTDPRVPPIEPAVDINGTALTLPQRLTNLSKLPVSDQTLLFNSLTDEENGLTGQWFVAKFQEELRKLMERRLERRKIALKFEDEVRRRDSAVMVKVGDVDHELMELRQGGGQLIEGRSVAGVGGTPKGK